MRTLGTIVLAVTAIIGSNAQDQFFPKHAFSDDDKSDQFVSDWYSQELKILKEPSLLRLIDRPSAESYRFTWLRTFHPAVAVRIDLRADGIAILTSKVASGAAGFPKKDSHLVENVSRPLSGEQTQSILARLNKLNLWALPSREGGPGNDGAEWIFEGVKGGKYHVISRWSPKQGEVRDLGLTFLFGLAQMRIPEDEIY